LRDALAAALLANPELAATSWEVRAREAANLQAGALPNPALGVSVEDLGDLGRRSQFASPNQTTVTLSQLVELGGKRAERLRLAGLERDLARWDYETRRATVLAETTKRFVAILATGQRLVLAGELVVTAEESARSVAAAVRAGAFSPVEEQRARLAAARARLDRSQLERELEASRLALAATWGGQRAVFSQAVGDLETVAEPPPFDAAVAGIDRNPDLARWSSEIPAREAEIDLEKSRRIPDVTMAGGFRRFDDGASAFVVEGSIPLPLFNRNEGAILAAQNRLARARAEQEALRVGTLAALGNAYQALLAAHGQVRAIAREVLPQARSAYEGSLDGFRKGLFRAIEVLDAQRALFEVRSQYLQALAAYHTAATDVERLAGAPLSALPEGRP
jgi:cobalt-zinc-cadmium efflux system outer membrane protein